MEGQTFFTTVNESGHNYRITWQSLGVAHRWVSTRPVMGLPEIAIGSSYGGTLQSDDSEHSAAMATRRLSGTQPHKGCADDLESSV